MLRIGSGQVPVLLIVSNSSANRAQADVSEAAGSRRSLSPPWLFPGCLSPARSTTGAFGSFVMIRIVAISGRSRRSAYKATVKSMSSPAARLSGVAGLASTVKPVEPIRRCTLVMTQILDADVGDLDCQELRRSLADGAEGEVVFETDGDRRDRSA